MRFLKIFISLLLAGFGLVFIILTVIFEGRVYIEAQRLEAAVLSVKRSSSQEVTKYRDMCTVRDMSNIEDNGQLVYPVLGYRLRFTDTIHYLIEAVCSRTEKGPFLVENGELKYGINKIKGSGVFMPVEVSDAFKKPISGPVSSFVLIGANRGGLYLVGIDQDKVVDKRIKPADWPGEGVNAPPTICTGWGNLCCDPVSQVGTGPAETRVLDCRDGCYPACLDRPIVVYLNTDPEMNDETRTAEVLGQETVVSFGFEIMDADSEIKEITLNFGDGEVYQAQNNQEVVEHTYRCTRTECLYQVTLSAQDTQGLNLPPTRLNSLTIIQRS